MKTNKKNIKNMESNNQILNKIMYGTGLTACTNNNAILNALATGDAFLPVNLAGGGKINDLTTLIVTGNTILNTVTANLFKTSGSILNGQKSVAFGKSNFANGQAIHIEGVGNISFSILFEINEIYVNIKTLKVDTKVDETAKFTPGTILYLPNFPDGGDYDITLMTVSSSFWDGNYTQVVVEEDCLDLYNNGTYFLYLEDSTEFGYASHTEGITCAAKGEAANAEGSYTVASGQYSHAEGNSTIASGDFSHAQNTGNLASGYYTHAGGFNSIASGSTSFVHISNSSCNHNYSAIIGGLSITSIEENTVYMPNAEIVGNANSIIMTSPDGTRYKITMANGGTLSITTA